MAPDRGTVELREAATGRLAGPPPSELRHLIHLGLTGDLGHAVLVDSSGAVEVWDVQRRRAVLTFDTGVRGGRVADFDGYRLVMLTDGPEPSVSVWSVGTGTRIAEVNVPGAELRVASLNPGSSELVTGDRTGMLTTWNLDRRLRNFELPGHEAMVNAMEFSPDGGRLVTAGSDGSATIWDTAPGRPLTRLDKHEAAIDAAKFSPDGRGLVTLGRDGAIALWDSTSFALKRYVTNLGAQRVAIAPAGDLLHQEEDDEAHLPGLAGEGGGHQALPSANRTVAATPMPPERWASAW